MKKFAIKKKYVISVVALLGLGLVWASVAKSPRASETTSVKQKAMLTVTAVKPQQLDWPVALPANGGIFAWQEAIIGSELSGLRLAEIKVNVGDIVHAGQVLARFDAETVAADVAQKEAALEEARAALAEAKSNVDRTKPLAANGVVSAQQMTKYLTAERSSEASVASAEATLRSARIRMRQTEVKASDDGVISSRSATLGSVASQGQELFKLIRQNRLEWRAEVPGTDLPSIKAGQQVDLVASGGATVSGKVRIIGPTLDPATRNGLVYVDLPVSADIHAGTFATGQFEIGRARALTVQQNAVVIRDGFGYVFKIGADGNVAQVKVKLGRRIGESIEITDGIGTDALLVDQGAGFLADGDVVKVASQATTPVPIVATRTSVPVQTTK